MAAIPRCRLARWFPWSNWRKHTFAKSCNEPPIWPKPLRSWGSIKPRFTVNAKRLDWNEGFAGGRQQLIRLPGSCRHQSNHKSSRFTYEKATKLDSELDYKPPFPVRSTRRNPRKTWCAQQDLNLRPSDAGLKTELFARFSWNHRQSEPTVSHLFTEG